MQAQLGQTICDPCGHPWICCVPDPFIGDELKRLQKKIHRENLIVRKTTRRDIEKVPMWDYEKYLQKENKSPEQSGINS